MRNFNFFEKIEIPSAVRFRINFLELMSIFLACRFWAHSWENQRVRLRTDNTQALAWINKGCSPNPTAMTLLREIFWISVQHNFQITAYHIPGSKNVFPDALSRLNEQQPWETLRESDLIPFCFRCNDLSPTTPQIESQDIHASRDCPVDSSLPAVSVENVPQVLSRGAFPPSPCIA